MHTCVHLDTRTQAGGRGQLLGKGHSSQQQQSRKCNVLDGEQYYSFRPRNIWVAIIFEQVRLLFRLSFLIRLFRDVATGGGVCVCEGGGGGGG